MTFTQDQIDVMAEYHWNSYDITDAEEMEEFTEDYLEDGEITSEPTQNFIDACIELRKIDVAEMNGYKVTQLTGTQRIKGETRCDLNIFDFGNMRVVFKS